MKIKKRLLVASALTSASGIAHQIQPVQGYQIFKDRDIKYGSYYSAFGDYIPERLEETPNSNAAKNAFLANLSTPYQTEDFEEIGFLQSKPIPIKSPVGTTFDAISGGIGRILTQETYGGKYPISGYNYLHTGNGYMTDYHNLDNPVNRGNYFKFDSPVSAIGFYITGERGSRGSSSALFLTKVDGSSYIALLPHGTNERFENKSVVGYFGIIAENASEAFTKATFMNISPRLNSLGIDDVTIAASPRSVPEPSAVIGLGLFLAGLTRSKQLKEKIKNKLAT